jgi:hypothetical protein
MLNQFRNKAKISGNFCLAMDDSNDKNNTAQLLTIQGTTQSFEAGEGPSRFKSFHGTQTGKDLFLHICETTEELTLTWTKPNGMTTGRAVGMTGKRTRLMG